MNDPVAKKHFCVGAGLLRGAALVIFLSFVFVCSGFAGPDPGTSGPAGATTERSPAGNPLHAIPHGTGATPLKGSGTGPIDAWQWRHPLPTGYNLLGITYGNNTFVTVGYGGVILTSENGITWTERSSGVTDGLTAVAYGNNTFVAVGYGPTILTSADAITWTGQRAEGCEGKGSCEGPGAIVFGNNAFVAVGNPLDPLHAGIPGNTQGVLASPDGITWTEWIGPGSLGFPPSFTGVAYGNSTFVAVGQTGIVFTSPDGTTWTEQKTLLGRGDSLLGVTYGNSTFVATGTSGAVFTSPEGITWTAQAQPLGTGASFNGVTYGNNTFVAVGQYYGACPYPPSECPSKATILTSSDGKTWTERKRAAGTASYNAVAYGKNIFVAVGGSRATLDGGAIFTSPDGKNWTLRTPRITADLIAVIRGGNTFVAVGAEGAILTSPGGKTWTAQWSKAGITLYAVTYGNNTFVAVGDATIVISPDGYSWKEQASGVSASLSDITFGNNIFVAVGDNGTILTSPDGVTWTARASGTHLPLSGVAFGSNTFVAVGEGGIFDPGIALTSPDGVTWKGRYAGFSHIAYGNSTFVAVGSHYTWELEDPFVSTISNSPDGIRWTERLAYGYTAFPGITYGNNAFAITANYNYYRPPFFAHDSGTYILSSPDGVSWTEHSRLRTKALSGVAAGNRTFVAVGAYGTILQSGTLCTYALSPPRIVASSSEGTAPITITAKGDAVCPAPDVSISAGWITYSDLVFANNKGSITLKVAANSLSAARRSTAYVGNGPVVVVQAGAPCNMSSLDPASASFDKAGGPGTFTVNVTPSDCIWTAAPGAGSASWVTIASGKSGAGTGTVAYSVRANKSDKARPGKVNVLLTKGGGRKAFGVEQGR